MLWIESTATITTTYPTTTIRKKQQKENERKKEIKRRKQKSTWFCLNIAHGIFISIEGEAYVLCFKKLSNTISYKHEH